MTPTRQAEGPFSRSQGQIERNLLFTLNYRYTNTSVSLKKAPISRFSLQTVDNSSGASEGSCRSNLIEQAIHMRLNFPSKRKKTALHVGRAVCSFVILIQFSPGVPDLLLPRGVQDRQIPASFPDSLTGFGEGLISFAFRMTSDEPVRASSARSHHGNHFASILACSIFSSLTIASIRARVVSSI